MGPPKPSYE